MGVGLSSRGLVLPPRCVWVGALADGSHVIYGLWFLAASLTGAVPLRLGTPSEAISLGCTQGADAYVRPPQTVGVQKLKLGSSPNSSRPLEET